MWHAQHECGCFTEQRHHSLDRSAEEVVSEPVKSSPKTGKQTNTHSEDKKSYLGNASIDGACNDTSEDMLKLSTVITSTVLNSCSNRGSFRTGPLNAVVVPKNSVGGWTSVNKVRKTCVSPSKTLNIPGIVVKSTGDLVV